MSEQRLPKKWRVFLSGLVIVAIFFIFFDVKSQKWYDWTGFGEDSTRERSEERNAKGEVQKNTETTKYQSGKSFWDWLELASGLAVPILIFYLGYQFERRDQKRSEQQAGQEKERTEQQVNLEREIAIANLRDEALEAYFDRMAELLLDKNLRAELLLDEENNDLNSDNSVRDVARIRTITILRRLESDTERQARIINFLRDAELLRFLLTKANLRGADLRRANLNTANLQGADLATANLQGADLTTANLKRANLTGANLEGSDLIAAYLKGANLTAAELSGAILILADLSRADLRRANLNTANLNTANLEGAILLSANLEGAILTAANLEGANLIAANLEGVKLSIDTTKETQANLNQAFYDKQTLFPEGFDPVQAGMQKI